jgi:hypothetical protein
MRLIAGEGAMGKDEKAVGLEEGGKKATTGPEGTKVRTENAENRSEELDPSAPGETGTTPGSNWK